MADRPTRVRTRVKPEPPRAMKTKKMESEQDAAMDRARCAEIAMLAAARGWGKKRGS